MFITNAQDTLIFISGHVTNINGGAPVSSHPVNIHADSSGPVFSYFNTVITDVNGHYKDSILIPINSQILFNVFTFDCTGMIHLVSLVSTNQPLIADFQICDSLMSCFANFNVHPSPGNPLKMQFVDQSSPNIDTWFWEFGDSTHSTHPNPVHIYPAFCL